MVDTQNCELGKTLASVWLKKCMAVDLKILRLFLVANKNMAGTMQSMNLCMETEYLHVNGWSK
jgi:hypothetical protein